MVKHGKEPMSKQRCRTQSLKVQSTTIHITLPAESPKKYLQPVPPEKKTACIVHLFGLGLSVSPNQTPGRSCPANFFRSTSGNRGLRGYEHCKTTLAQFCIFKLSINRLYCKTKSLSRRFFLRNVQANVSYLFSMNKFYATYSVILIEFSCFFFRFLKTGKV